MRYDATRKSLFEPEAANADMPRKENVMNHARRIVFATILFACLFASEGWAQRGGYRPPHRAYEAPKYEPQKYHHGDSSALSRSKDLRHVTPEEFFKAGDLKPKIFDSTLRRNLAEGSKDQVYWQAITTAFGLPTRELSEAYLLFTLLEDGRLLATTNFLQAGNLDAPVQIQDAIILQDQSAIAKIASDLFGVGTDIKKAGVKLKLFSEGGPSSSFEHFAFDRSRQTLRINSNLFDRAEVHFSSSGQEPFYIERVERPQPPPRWMAKLNECCVFTGIPPRLRPWETLAQSRLQTRDSRIANLAWDVGVGSLLKDKAGKGAILHPSQIQNDPLKALRELASNGPKGAPLVVFGHTEGDSFVIREGGNTGKEIFSVSFSALSEIASDANRPLIMLGCYTGEHLKEMAKHPPYSSDFSAGALNELKANVAANVLASALGSSRNVKELVENLSNTEMHLWVSPQQIMAAPAANGQRTLRASIYGFYRRGTELVWSIVGFLFIQTSGGSDDGS